MAALHLSYRCICCRGVKSKRIKRWILLLRVRFFYTQNIAVMLWYTVLCVLFELNLVCIHWIGGACTCLHFFTFSFHVGSEWTIEWVEESPINFNCIYPYLHWIVFSIFSSATTTTKLLLPPLLLLLLLLLRSRAYPKITVKNVQKCCSVEHHHHTKARILMKCEVKQLWNRHVHRH